MRMRGAGRVRLDRPRDRRVRRGGGHGARFRAGPGPRQGPRSVAPIRAL